MRNILIRIALSTFLIGATPMVLACTVAEIVDMAGDGAGRDAIKSKCKSKVDDAPRCRFEEVLTFAIAKKDDDYIEKRCALCESPMCSTRMGGCPLTENTGRIIDGGACWCATPYGPVGGKAVCQ
jgi:hypothetical protein